MICPRCGFVNDAREQYCRRCSETLRPPSSPPRGVRVETKDAALRITRRWFHPLAFVAVLGLISFLIWWGITGGAGSHVSPKWSFLVNVAATVLGVLGAYPLGVVVLNRTVIDVTPERVSFSHGPLPWILPRRTVDAGSIARLSCEQHITHIDMSVRDHDYELRATMSDGQTVSLLEDIPNAMQARYIEQEIARWLGIDNGAVSGD